MKAEKLMLMTFVKLILTGYLWTISTTLASGAMILLPQTGQTKCYDVTGTPISCDGTGQDGDILAGAPWPCPRFTDNRNSTVNDNLTGLTWAKNANLMVSRDPSFDKDPSIFDNTIIMDGNVTWQHALDYIKKLNQERYLGFSDWRLPNANELLSLVDASQNFPAIPQGHPFLNVQNDQNGIYWSSTTNSGTYPASHKEVAKTVYIGGFGIYYGWPKNQTYRVWPVRGSSNNVLKTGQTTCFDTDGIGISCTGTGQDGETQTGVSWNNPRFTENNNGTVVDDLTGLVWSKDANVMASRDQAFDSDGTPSDGLITWQNAFAYIKKLNRESYLGFTDWRLPNTIELASLLDFSNSKPSLPSGHPFINIQQGYWSSTTSYWSSNTNTYTYGDGWVTAMYGGGARASASKSSNEAVWPVRGGDFPRKLTVTVSGLGTVTPDSGTLTWNGNSGNGRYAQGSSITLKAISNANNIFTGWSGACAGTGDCTITMDSEKAVSAAFTIDTFTPSVSPSPTNGTISCTAASYGGESKCTITPTPGFRITGLTDNGVNVIGNVQDNSYAIQNVTGNHTLASTFGINIGDIDQDSIATIKDALFALKVAIGLIIPTQDQIVRADVAPLDANQKPVGDGKVDIADVICILRRATGLLSW